MYSAIWQFLLGAIRGFSDGTVGFSTVTHILDFFTQAAVCTGYYRLRKVLHGNSWKRAGQEGRGGKKSNKNKWNVLLEDM